jgi:hypothetical protein
MLHDYCSLPAALLLSMLSSCAGSKEPVADASHSSFTVIEATYEDWHAGRKEGGSGTDYQLITVIKTDRTLQFDSIRIQDRSMTLPLSVARFRGPVSNQPVSFQKGDTILLVASYTASAAGPNTADGSHPGTAALISFREEGKSKKATIPQLTKKEGLPRPQY